MLHQTHKTLAKEAAVIDRLVNIAAVVHPLMAMPQVYDIYTSHDVEGVSLATWTGFMVVGFVFLAYGIAHRLRPIILTQILWFVVDLLVISGILYYR
jgi:uncharacterized protein with PQ loop repeat